MSQDIGLHMSSELRLKKLRGSGGYVMAQVSDEQQMKGNLGGPDLFLAPIGRIDTEKISKYFCNTCEKEFGGCPKIEYQNPNEEVAENLILVEKGQYQCSACSSTIAEYREFKKSDKDADIGPAKAEKPDAGRQTYKQDIMTEPINPDKTEEPDADGQTACEESTDPAITSIQGMTVFDENAKRLGTAKHVGVDSTQTVVLAITGDDGIETSVPWSKVRTVGEVILLGDSDTTQEVDEPGGCTDCGFANKHDAKFCEECGIKL